MSRPQFIALLLALVTLAVYEPVVGNGFINYDDGDYLTQNEMVQGGLTVAGFKWAFTTFHSANWHPLTWLSLMADCQMFGVSAAGSHCVNALFHAVNTVLLFALWLRLTRREKEPNAGLSSNGSDAIWPAAFIAALFALHPLHVESVAWISERKDVLSAFFGLLTLLCYANYAKSKFVHFPPHPQSLSPRGEREEDASHEPDSRTGILPVRNRQAGSLSYFTHHSSPPYFLALFFFACGLMSKPMLVTLPFVMLLLDYWPLQRLHLDGKLKCLAKSDISGGEGAAATTEASSTLQRLFIEKIPFFLLTAASCVVTCIAQNRGAVRTLAQVPLVYRLENAPVAVATYLLKLIWPARLAIIYPMPHSISPVTVIAATATLIFITVSVWLSRKRCPFLPVGWFWFLGTLVPVLGLVKVGDAALADRYTYIPSIGIFMMVAFGAQKLARRFSLPKFLFPLAAVLILGALTIVTEKQLHFWRNDETLFKHALDVTTDNPDALINYGVALEYAGRPLEAMSQYRRAEQLAPASYMVHADLGNLLSYMGKSDEALEQYRQAAQLDPHSATLHDRLGSILADLGRFTDATNEFHQAMRLDPASPAPRLHLGMALAAHDDFAGATNEFSEALRMNPDDPAPLVEWARALLQQGRDAEAMEKLDEALQVDPNNFQTLAFAARALAADENSKIRNGPAALEFAKKADALTGGQQPLVEDALGMAYAENGQFDEAQKAANEAIRLAIADGMKPETIAAMRERLRLYEKRQPWRESFLLTK